MAPASLGTSALRQGSAALTRTAPGVGVLQGERKANPGKRSYWRITSGWPYPDPMLGVKPLLKKEKEGFLFFSSHSEAGLLMNRRALWLS